MDWRLKAYREANKSDVKDPSVTGFFAKYGIPTFNMPALEPSEKVLEAFKVFIEQQGKPFNYMTFDEDAEKQRQQTQTSDQRSEEEKKWEVSEWEEF